jgi:hypothetical protein
MPSTSNSADSRCLISDIRSTESKSVSVAPSSAADSASAARLAALRPISPGYLEVFLEPVMPPRHHGAEATRITRMQPVAVFLMLPPASWPTADHRLGLDASSAPCFVAGSQLPR